MELQIQKQNLCINDLVFDSQVEQPVEADLLLPDYCPDIQRILHCDLCCLIHSTKAEQQRLSIDGELRLTVLYVSDSGTIRGIDQKQPFTRHLDSKNTLNQPLIEVLPKVDYLNCRAVSSRRLEIRGAVTLKVKAINCAKAELLQDCEGQGIQLKKTAFSVDSGVNAAESTFTVREELDLGAQQPVAQILSSRMEVQLSDHKAISGKIIAKGELKLQLLYLPLSADEKELPQELEYSLPFSQIIPAEGADDSENCCLSLSLAAWDVQPKPDVDGELKVLAVEAQLRAQVSLHQAQEFSVVQDCYSTLYPLSREEKQLSFLNFVRCVQETHRIREPLSAAKNVQSILSAWARVREVQCRQDEDEIQINGTLSLMALVVDTEGQPQFYEEQVRLEHNLPITKGKNLLFGLSLQPISVEASLNNTAQPELRCQLQLSGTLYSVERQSGISKIRVEEGTLRDSDEHCALCIYYADPGESVWNIAKQYHSDLTAVMEENGLDQDILPQRTMLLIPLC